MHGKNYFLPSEKDHSICSLLGVRRNFHGPSNRARLLKESNFHCENINRTDYSGLVSSTNSKRPSFLRLDSTGQDTNSPTKELEMAPQNQKQGVHYITETMSQQSPVMNRFDRSPTSWNCSGSKMRKRNPPLGQHQPMNKGYPGNSLMSGVSGYACSRATAPQHKSDYSRSGYPFHQFFPPPQRSFPIMPLGMPHFRPPFYNGGCCDTSRQQGYFGQKAPLLFQAYPFMPGRNNHRRSMYYHQKNTRSRSASRERGRQKRRPKRQVNDSDASRNDLVESFENLSVEEENCCSSVNEITGTMLTSALSGKQDDVKELKGCVSEELTAEETRKSFEVDKEILDDLDDGSHLLAGCVNVENSDETNVQSGLNEVSSCDLARPGHDAMVIECMDCTTECTDTVTHDEEIGQIGGKFEVCEEDENGVDSGFHDEKNVDDEGESEASVSKKEKSVNLETDVGDVDDFKIVTGTLTFDGCSTAPACQSDFVIVENGKENGYFCAMDMMEVKNGGLTSESHDSEGVSHISMHVTGLKFENETEHNHCLDPNHEAEHLDFRTSLPNQGENGSSISTGATCKQKKRSRPSAKKRKRMKQKKGTINVSICEMTEKSVISKSASDSDLSEKECASSKTNKSSVPRGCFQRVAFIVGSESDTDDDFDIKFVQSPRHSPPKSCPKLQFNLLTSESEDDKDGTDSDSDFESDENSAAWSEDLLNSFCIKDPYSPFSFQLQCTSMPVKKSASSPELSPPNAFAFDVTIKRSLDPDRPRVSFAASNLTEVIEEDEKLADEYQEARKGPWEQLARDRSRFERRVADVESNIAYVFESGHRKRIYERFYTQID